MRMIGRYEVCGRLGKGGMGSVFKARLPGLARIVALKLLDPAEILVAVTGMDELKRQFLHEARVMSGIRHPHVAQIWDLDETADGLPYFVMEYTCNNLGALMGESYMVEAPTRRLAPDTAVRYALQALEGLARMHHEGVVHRDFKPFNLLLTDEDTVKIIDFGLSKLRGEDEFNTAPGAMVGSPYYAAPEQEMDPASADGRADLYGVGVTLFRMLTGMLPYDDQTGEAMRSVRAFNPELEEAWDRFFAKALARDPKERHATAQAMAAELKILIEKWRENRERICGLPDADEDITRFAEAPDPDRRIRSGPIKTGPRSAHQCFDLDELGRPRHYAANDFSCEGDGTVRDHAHGLVWQEPGSEWPVEWEAAHEHVAALNAQGFAGYRDWRLPTVDELMMLLREPPGLGELCVAPVFDPRLRQAWSCDRRTFTQAWTMDAVLGFIGSHDFTCRLHVRAVRSEH